jgi:hypothetical protein
MDFPSQDWEYNDLDDFDTVPPIITGNFTFELYAQLRPTGRILDNFWAELGGSKKLDININLHDGHDTLRPIQGVEVQNPEAS